jgi:hypothetical protein
MKAPALHDCQLPDGDEILSTEASTVSRRVLPYNYISTEHDLAKRTDGDVSADVDDGDFFWGQAVPANRSDRSAAKRGIAKPCQEVMPDVSEQYLFIDSGLAKTMVDATTNTVQPLFQETTEKELRQANQCNTVLASTLTSKFKADLKSKETQHIADVKLKKGDHDAKMIARANAHAADMASVAAKHQVEIHKLLRGHTLEIELLAGLKNDELSTRTDDLRRTTISLELQCAELRAELEASSAKHELENRGFKACMERMAKSQRLMADDLQEQLSASCNERRGLVGVIKEDATKLTEYMEYCKELEIVAKRYERVRGKKVLTRSKPLAPTANFCRAAAIAVTTPELERTPGDPGRSASQLKQRVKGMEKLPLKPATELPKKRSPSAKSASPTARSTSKMSNPANQKASQRTSLGASRSAPKISLRTTLSADTNATSAATSSGSPKRPSSLEITKGHSAVLTTTRIPGHRAQEPNVWIPAAQRALAETEIPVSIRTKLTSARAAPFARSRVKTKSAGPVKLSTSRPQSAERVRFKGQVKSDSRVHFVEGGDCRATTVLV